MPARRLGLVLLAFACGPAVRGEVDASEASEGESTAFSSTSTTSVSSSSSSASSDASSTSVDGCGGEVALQWSIEGDPDDPWPLAAAALPKGGFALVGYDGPRTFNEDDAFVETRDAAGDVIWAREYVGINDLNDRAIGVAVGNDGSVYALIEETVSFQPHGKSAISDGRLVVVQYTSDGLVGWRWERERPPVMGTQSYSPDGMIHVVGDRVLVLERARSEPTNLVELAVDGGFVSEVELAPSHDGFATWAFASDGEIAYASHEGEDESLRIRVQRFADDGGLRWSETIASDDGLTVIAGRSGETHVAFGRDTDGAIMLRRLDDDGTTAWTIDVPDVPAYEYGYAVVGSAATDDTILLMGRGPSASGPGWVVGLSPAGCVLWHFETDFLADGVHDDFVIGTIGGEAVVRASEDTDNRDAPWLAMLHR